MTPRRRSAAAEGFTLIELLMAISILGIIATAVVGLIITSIRTTADTRERLNDTGAYMITSGYFGPDVQGANQLAANGQLGAPTQRIPPSCGNSHDPLIVEMKGTDYEDIRTHHKTTISYVLTDAGRTLVRRTCAGDDADPESDLIMAEGLDPPRPPTIRCREGGGNTPEVSCNSNSSGLVRLTLTTAGGVTESLIGTRRTS